MEPRGPGALVRDRRPASKGPGVRISLTLSLPSAPSTLPFVRHLTAAALGELGVAPSSIDDVALALTEAVANVVKHAGADAGYEVRLVLDDHVCEICVADRGRGFDPALIGTAMAPPGAERGRGMALMAAVVDSVCFESQPADGTVVRLVKDLELRRDGLLDRLLR